MKSIKVELNISNSNNQDYPSILIRKMFNMVFVAENGRGLNIYTAIAFGGMGKQTPDMSKLVSNIGKDACQLLFSYSIKDGKAKISYEDISKNLFSQAGVLKEVWGNGDGGEYEEFTNQKDLATKVLAELGVQVGRIHFDQDKVLHFKQNKENHNCFLARGKKVDTENKSEITLDCNRTDSLGVESLFWIRTKVVLDTNILDTPIDFVLKLSDSTYYMPDFSWYIAPPEGYRVDVNESNVKYQKAGNKEKVVYNALSSVSDETTVHFKEWVEKENIDSCEKSRFRKAEVVSDSKDCTWLSDGDNLSCHIILKNPHIRENRQFIAGLIIAFLLSFCSVSEWLSQALLNLGLNNDNCTYFICKLIPFMNPTLILLAYMSYKYKYHAGKVLAFCRKFGIILTLLLQLILVIVSMFDTQIFIDKDKYINGVVWIYYIVTLLSLGIFVIASMARNKRFEE